MEALIAIILLGVLNVTGTTTSQMERQIEKSLRDQLGATAQVRAEVDRGHRSPFSRTVDRIEVDVSRFDTSKMTLPPMQPAAGGARLGAGINHLVVHARNFDVLGMHVEKMDLTIDDIRYDLWRAVTRREVRVVRIGPTTVSAVFGEPALQRFLAPRVTALRDFRLSLEPGRVLVTGKTDTRVPVEVEIGGRLAARQGDQIHLLDPEFAVVGVGLPGFVCDQIAKQLNPVVDLGQQIKVPLQLTITRINVTPVTLSIRARVKLIPPPAAAGSSAAPVSGAVPAT